jgi:hypothetical protein
MNRWLVGFVLVVLALVGLAFYLGWFRLTSDSSAGQFSVTFTVDTAKVREDRTQALDKVRDPAHPAQD